MPPLRLYVDNLSFTASDVCDVLNKKAKAVSLTSSIEYAGADIMVTSDRDKAIKWADYGKIVVLVKSIDRNLGVQYTMSGMVVTDANSSKDVADEVKKAVTQKLKVQQMGEFISALPSRLEQSKSTSIHALKRNLGIRDTLMSVKFPDDVFITVPYKLKNLSSVETSQNKDAVIKMIEVDEKAPLDSKVLDMSLKSIVILVAPFHDNDVSMLNRVRLFQAGSPSSRLAMVFFDEKNLTVNIELLKQLVSDGLDQINHRGHISSINNSNGGVPSATLFNQMASNIRDLPINANLLFQKITSDPSSTRS